MTGLEFGLISLFLSFVTAGTVKINTQCPHVDRVRTIEYSEAAAPVIYETSYCRPLRKSFFSWCGHAGPHDGDIDICENRQFIKRHWYVRGKWVTNSALSNRDGAEAIDK